MTNPTFSLGIYTFANVRALPRESPEALRRPRSRPATSTGTGRWTFYGAYAQDELQAAPRNLSINGGLRYEGTTMPIDQGGRDSALINLSDPAPTVGSLYENPSTYQPVAAGWRGVGRVRRRLDVGARRLRAVLQHQQPAEPDRHGDEPAGDAARSSSPTRRFRARRSSAASATRSGRCNGSWTNPRAPHVERQRAARAAGELHRDGRLCRARAACICSATPT